MAQIKLAWDPNTEPDMAGYRVYYGTASRTYGTPIDVGNATTYTLNGLSPRVVYYIAVTAYNMADYESAYSNEVSGQITEAPISTILSCGPVGANLQPTFSTLPSVIPDFPHQYIVSTDNPHKNQTALRLWKKFEK